MRMATHKIQTDLVMRSVANTYPRVMADDAHTTIRQENLVVFICGDDQSLSLWDFDVVSCVWVH